MSHYASPVTMPQQQSWGLAALIDLVCDWHAAAGVNMLDPEDPDRSLEVMQMTDGAHHTNAPELVLLASLRLPSLTTFTAADADKEHTSESLRPSEAAAVQ